MDHEHLPGRGEVIFQQPTEEEKWRRRQPVFTSLVHGPEGTMGRNTSIAPGAEIEASDRRYTVAKDGSLRRCLPTGEPQPRPHSRNRRR